MTDKDHELRKKALELKEYCTNRDNCTGCVFNSSGRPKECDIAFSHFNGEIAAEPRDWEVCSYVDDAAVGAIASPRGLNVPKDIAHIKELIDQGAEIRLHLCDANGSYEIVSKQDLEGWLSRDGKEDIPLLIAAGRLRYITKGE